MGAIRFIINPAGHGGTGLYTWEKFKALWPEKVDPKDAIVTDRPNQAEDIVAASSGSDTFAAVGGDGTVGQVFSAMIDQCPHSTLAIIPAGTGNDIARNVGINSLEDSIAALRGKQKKSFDLIRVDYTLGEESLHRYAFLSAAVGFSAIPMIRPWMKRLLGPTGAYYLATLLQIIAYHPPRMSIRVDGRDQDGCIWIVMVANAERVSGDSMCIAPGARIDDGVLNISIIPSMPKLKMVTKMLPRVATGDHVNEPGVSYLTGEKVEILSTPCAIIDLDGDIYGATPASFTVCPGALRVMTPGSSFN